WCARLQMPLACACDLPPWIFEPSALEAKPVSQNTSCRPAGQPARPARDAVAWLQIHSGYASRWPPSRTVPPRDLTSDHKGTLPQLGVAAYRVDGPTVLDLSLFDDVSAVCELERQRQILLREQDRETRRLQCPELGEHLLHHQGRKPLRRLVEQQQVRIAH